jgi:hypothetical protein
VVPRVQYGTAYLLIRGVMGSVPCSDDWEIGVVTLLGTHGANDFENLQEPDFQDFEQQPAGEQGK